MAITEDAKDSSWVKDLSHEMFQACLSFYDRNPIVGATGFLLLVSTVPLFFILRFVTNMRRVDNELVVNTMRLQLQSKTRRRKGKSSKAAANAAASTSTTAGG